ncbi:hypothetical protein MSHOH_0764 [Methanosarcina horonobensis HB-1 = JCM 15518]|uniref:Uncharacterized protein n=1 Tax=Methanosarcina horonobensis HB-1 = JCM 15518 TaxID=1434110 RepID=A0A0E3SBQ2_9EURY|nr:hypothetical protein [Methanosarcina horonobensis]AKB77247.1 hypothetical protein MSHOH_0764 [Methanosarcina horonobensis HB-1 = JCM 15518]
MDEKAAIEPANPVKEELTGKKMPLVSCDKYDEEERKALIKEEQGEIEEAKVEPIHPSEQRGGKKKSILDTCK